MKKFLVLEKYLHMCLTLNDVNIWKPTVREHLNPGKWEIVIIYAWRCIRSLAVFTKVFLVFSKVFIEIIPL